MLIEFRRAPRGESDAWIHRPDGVVLVLPSYSRKHRVPHDLAHAATEGELGLRRGMFGLIAAGALFGNMRVAQGKLRHDARAVSARVLRAHARSLTIAEVVSGVLHQAVEHGRPIRVSDVREGWGVVSQEPFPWTAAQVTRAADVLARCGERWTALPADGVLRLDWPVVS